jgi:hypothetical protein
MPLAPHAVRAAIALLLGALAPALAAQPIRIHGRLVAPDGVQGIPGAVVELVPRFETCGEANARLAGKSGPTPLALARTEAGGFFRLDAPRGGLYSVVARAEGLHPLEHPLALVEETDLPPAVMDPVSSPPAEQMFEGWRPLRVDGERVRVIGLEPSRLVTGRVVALETGAPIPNALVWSPEAALAPPVLSGADGTFRLRLPMRFRREVRAAAPGHFPAGAEIPAGGEAAPVMLTLTPAAGVAGRVVDEQGGAVAGSFLTALDPTRPEEEEPPLGWSRMDGSFRLASLLPGRKYKVTATQEGFAPGEAEAATAPAGKASPPIRIVLTRGQRAFGRVVDEAGRPVAGVLLTLDPFSEDDPPPSPFEEGGSGLKGSSDDRGAFEIPDVSTGTFVLRAMKEGFAAFSKAGVEIAAGSGRADLGTITLESGVTIEGRVTDSKGQPLEEAKVFTSPFAGFMASGTFGIPSRKPTVTGADGSFRIEDLKRGERYDLSALHPGHAPATARGVEAPAEDLRIVLQTGRTLSGRVVGPERAPVPGAEIQAREESRVTSEGSGISTIFMRHLAVTDAEGRFRIGALEAGTLSLVVSARRYRTRRLEGFRVPDEDVDSLEIVLDRGARLEGRVVDGEGEPVAQARLEARLQNGEGFSDLGSEPHAVSEEDGSYRLEGLETAQYRIAVESPAHGQTDAVAAIFPGTNRLDLVLEGGVEVTGRAVDESGAPVADAAILLQAIPSGRGFDTVSSADGTFRFPAVRDGLFRLAGQARGFAEASAPREIQISGQPLSGLELRFSRGVTLTGRLLGLTPAELRSAWVQAHRVTDEDGLTSSGEGTVDAQGRYSIAGLTPGEWEVVANAGTGRSGRGTLHLAAGVRDPVLDIEFPEGATLTGRVLLDGAPWSGVQVIASQVDDDESGSGMATTAYDGRFTLPNLSPGRYSLTLTSPGGLGYNQMVEIAGDREVTIEIATGRLSGRVVSAIDGEPVSGALVSLEGVDPKLGSTFLGPSVRTGEGGTFEIPRLAPGAYKATILREGFAPAEAALTVRPGGGEVMEIVLSPLEAPEV